MSSPGTVYCRACKVRVCGVSALEVCLGYCECAEEHKCQRNALFIIHFLVVIKQVQLQIDKLAVCMHIHVDMFGKVTNIHTFQTRQLLMTNPEGDQIPFFHPRGTCSTPSSNGTSLIKFFQPQTLPAAAARSHLSLLTTKASHLEVHAYYSYSTNKYGTRMTNSNQCS